MCRNRNDINTVAKDGRDSGVPHSSKCSQVLLKIVTHEVFT